MLVIPVIDVRGGEAVAASRGDRAAYKRLETPVSATADPVAVALGLHALFPFPTLYVADLDGIEGRGADLAMQRRVAGAWPGTELWIDDGTIEGRNADVGRPPTPTLPTRGRKPVESQATAPVSTPVPPPLWGRLGGGEPRGPRIASEPPYQAPVSHVLGSESLASLEDYERARKCARPAAPLSLDFRGNTFLGPPALLEDAALWPNRIIVMTLARVGSGEGPDLARLAAVIARAEGRKVFAAGGVRNGDDLKALRDIGAAGALVATALHTGAITPADLAAFGALRAQTRSE